MKRIKTEMTSKERLTAYQKGEEVDRIPVSYTHLTLPTNSLV